MLPRADLHPAAASPSQERCRGQGLEGEGSASELRQRLALRRLQERCDV